MGRTASYCKILACYRMLYKTKAETDYLEFENQKRSGPSTHDWEDVIFLKRIFKIQGVMVWTGFM